MNSALLQYAPTESTSLTPARAPLAMRRQPLHGAHTKPHDGLGGSKRLGIVLGASALLAFVAALLTFSALNRSGLSVFEGVMLALVFLNTFWIAASAVTAAIGAILLMRGAPARERATPFKTESRTALVYPIYNEDFAAVLARAHEGLEALGQDAQAFDVFFLSDSNQPEKIAEEMSLMAAYRTDQPFANVFYRRRANNFERKAGNIADFIRNWGARYEYFVVYDADSVMEADALRALVQRMDNQPSTALIQTVPSIIGARSLYAHMQQFAISAYGPLFGHGLAWWSEGAGNYWGHNAIIRIRAFAQNAGLPKLKGAAPFGGHILSHDFVEAALLRRAGWRVEIAPDIIGSYEQAPPTVIDAAARDRRWAQGNIQHAALLTARGLDHVSRAHLAAGIMGYGSSLLWVGLFLIGLIASWMTPERFDAPDTALAAGAFTLALLLAPKWLAMLVWLSGRLPGWKRDIRFPAGLALETITSTLLSPILIVNQAVAVLSTLIGRDAGWRTQERERTHLDLTFLLRLFAPYKAAACAIVVVAWFVSPAIGFAATPAALSLMSAAFISHALSQHMPAKSWLANPRAVRAESSDG